MYLKSIEVQGFKSFANKIVFQFNNGITGIVGPNGSGKSNVADAVRWVLGEQRIKQLRGASMQDVIFSGTVLRKAVGSAYVAITLDNSDHSLAIDYEEVTIARRIFRSGESEYLINGSVCRLKDVNELFYDTGIGKEGYSIIGQGQIDRILSSKPEDRRELFDEAAGIVKYKRRKFEAVKKLESERMNLLRVSDILAELDKQVGPLEKQSEKAKIYLKKKEELKTLDINVFLLESEKMRTKIEDLTSKITIADNDLKEANAKNEALTNEYKRVEEILETLNTEIEEDRASLANNDILREKLEGEIKLLQEQINSATGNREHLNQRLSAVDAQIAAKEEEKKAVLEKKAVIDESVNAKISEREEAKAKLIETQKEIENLNFSMENSKNCIIELLNERASIKTQLGKFDTFLEQKNIRLSELNAGLLRAKTYENEQTGIIDKLEEEFNKVSDEIKKLNFKQKDMESKASSMHSVLSEKDSKLREAQTKYHQEKSKLDALINLNERYEGFSGPIRKVMELKETEPGLCGVVADLLKVDAQYETAIETALGGNIQNIVTDDENTAKKMISYLKTNKLGRATFLPLTSLEHPQEFKTPEVLKEKGVIGMADELVNCEAVYRPVAKAMLGRIVVVDNVDNALKIARKFDYGIRMVTIEGELLVPGGAISGGTFKNNSNLLGRSREIDALKKSIDKLTKAVDDANKDIEDTKAERNRLRTEIENGRRELQDAFIKQNTARLNVLSAKEKIGDMMNDLKSLKAEEQEIKDDIVRITSEKESFTAKLADSEKLEKTENENVAKNQIELDKFRSIETERLNVVSDFDVQVEKLLQQQDFEKQNLDRIDGEENRFVDEKREILENINLSAEDIEIKQKNIEQIKETIKASHSTQSDKEAKLNAKIEKRDTLTSNQKKFFDQKNELTERISTLDKELYRLTSQKEKCEESMAGQTSYMWQEYEITLRDALSFRDENLTDLPSMKKEVSSIKDAIRKLGDVNVNAIEEYKEVAARHEFLTGQHNDLVESEKSLVKIIDELDEAMRKQFREKFVEISEEFDKVFKELFGGGQATLELMEDEDILEAGIRIIAQPPGKKLQNMMQLSGGEKALTAISLLFAIQNLKPSPFCLLDEIEAALDESNVERFAKYLHKMTKNTQFIVITHRRGTMDQANQLYGITMQEKGVSALVSVDLIDRDIKK
ncbi:MAG: chromosome segregation protein SMC [Lachnospiraceae bacterium]|nr:chromosome segregation protein SMC [Lachnospiraceae bacterium]